MLLTQKLNVLIDFQLLPDGIRPVPWHVGHVMLSLPVNSTYGNWAMSSRLPSPSKESLSESLSSPRRPEFCLSGRSDRLLSLRDHRVPMAAQLAHGGSSQSLPPTTARLHVDENDPFCQKHMLANRLRSGRSAVIYRDCPLPPVIHFEHQY